MSQYRDPGAVEVLNKAESLFRVPYAECFEDSLTFFRSMDPSQGMDALLRRALGDVQSGAQSGVQPDAGPDAQEALQSAVPREAPQRLREQRGSVAEGARERPLGERGQDPWRPVRGSAPELSPDMENGPAAHPAGALQRAQESMPAPLHLPISGRPLEKSSSAETAAGTRLLTGLCELQHLFRAVTVREAAEQNDPIQKDSVQRRSVQKESADVSPQEPGPSFPSLSSSGPSLLGPSLSRGPISRVLGVSHPAQASWDLPGSAAKTASSTAPDIPPNTDPDSASRAVPNQGLNQALNPALNLVPSLAHLPAPSSSGIPGLHPVSNLLLALPSDSTSGQVSDLASDPLWEALLFDRMMDRFEERLREQAIRQMGFTGGRI